MALSNDGKRIVSGSGDRTVKVWDAATGQEILTLKGHTGMVSSVALSADGKRIVSGDWDKTLKVWDAATGQEILTLKGHTGMVSSVALSADGKRIVSGDWDTHHGDRHRRHAWEPQLPRHFAALQLHDGDDGRLPGLGGPQLDRDVDRPSDSCGGGRRVSRRRDPPRPRAELALRGVACK